MSTWDSEDYEPSAAAAATTTTATAKVADKWEEEDDNETKDNWEEENDEDSEEESEGEAAAAVQVKKKKSLKETLAEKEKATEEKNAKAEAASAVDKLVQPNTDGTQSSEAVGQIDQFEPTSKEQFDKFGELLKEKIIKYENSSFYVAFLESLLRDACTNLEADDVKKILNTVNAVSNEKMKQQKATKGKKKPKKATLVVGKDTAKEEIGGEVDYDDFDDYM